MNERFKIKYVFQKRQRNDELTVDDVRKLRKEIRSYLADLKVFHVDLKELCAKRIKRHDRNICLNLALEIMNDEKLTDAFVDASSIPVKETSRLTGLPSAVIEKNKDLTAAYILLFGSDKHSFLARYLTIGTSAEEDEISEKNVKGIKLKDFGVSDAVLTPMGNFLYLDSKDKNLGTGEIVEGKPALLTPERLKFSVITAAVITAFLIIFSYSFYRGSKQIYLMSGPQVTFTYNGLQRLIKIEGNNSSGNETVSKTVLSDKKIDSSIAEIIDNAVKNGYIEKNSDVTLVVISGKFKKEDFTGSSLNSVMSKYGLTLRINMNEGNLLVLTPN